MHYHLPSHVLFFELIGIPYLYEVSVEKNEPVTDSMYYCVNKICLSPFYCNTKSYCPFRLNQTYFIYLLECVIVCLSLAPITGLFTKVCAGFHPYIKSISGWETGFEQKLKWVRFSDGYLV